MFTFYIMCVTHFDKREDELKTVIPNAIYSSQHKNTIEYYLPKLAPYIPNDSDTVEMKHEMIAIALIHTLMMEWNTTWSIFQKNWNRYDLMTNAINFTSLLFLCQEECFMKQILL